MEYADYFFAMYYNSLQRTSFLWNLDVGLPAVDICNSFIHPSNYCMALRAHLRATVIALLAIYWALATTGILLNMRIVTYNLRYDALPDNLTVQDSLNALPDPLNKPHYLSVHQEQPWSTRRIRIAENLLSSNIDIACEPYLLKLFLDWFSTLSRFSRSVVQTSQ